MNIPETILRKARAASRMTEEEFDKYIEGLKEEGKVYSLNFFIIDNVPDTVLNLCIEMYVQYQIFAKIEYEDISADKLETLHNIIDAFNHNYEKRTPIVPGGVTFL